MTSPVLTLIACHNPLCSDSPAETWPTYTKFSAEFETAEEAQAFAALFPKGCKLRATQISGGFGAGQEHYTRGYVAHEISMAPNRTTGEVNETGIKRYKAILKAAAKLGVEVAYTTPYGNSYPSQAAFEEALGI